MGGMIAIGWMNRPPLEINSAVLINTSVRPYSPFFHRLRWKNYPSIISMLFQSAEKMDKNILDLTSNLHQNDAILLTDWEKWRTQHRAKNKYYQSTTCSYAVFSLRKLRPSFANYRGKK